MVNNHNGSEGSATELACIENDALAEFLTAWKALYASGALANKNGSGDEFVAGRQLIMTDSSSKVANIMNKIGGRFELGIAPYLKVSESSASGATVSGSCLVMERIHVGGRAEDLVKKGARDHRIVMQRLFPADGRFQFCLIMLAAVVFRNVLDKSDAFADSDHLHAPADAEDRLACFLKGMEQQKV